MIDGAMPHLLGVERGDFHPVLLVRGFRDSHPVVRACNESHYGIHAASRVGRWRSDRSGTLPLAPVKGAAWTCSLFVDGGPGWCLGRRFSRRDLQKGHRLRPRTLLPLSQRSREGHWSVESFKAPPAAFLLLIPGFRRRGEPHNGLRLGWSFVAVWEES